MRKSLAIVLAVAAVLAAAVLFFKFSGAGAQLFWQWRTEGFLLPYVGFGALIDSINPCAFSILLLTIAFLFSIGKRREKVLALGAIYIFGIFIAYFAIGLGLLRVLHLFGTPHFIAKLAAVVLVTFGLAGILAEFFPRFPNPFHIPHAAHHKMAELMERGSVLTAFLLGGLVGVCEFPCTGGPYLAVTLLLRDMATYAKGAAYLLFYNVIFVLPLLVILFLASEEKLVQRVRGWQRSERKSMRLLSGAAMIGLGILVYFL